MKNKKVIIIMLVIVIGIFSLNLVNLLEKINESKEPIKSNNMLTMMLETESGTGIYEEVTQSEWPQEGYIFNTNLSKCENGGIVFWDDENKSVKMKSNISDKCYVYFDKYNKAELNVSIQKNVSSITITVTASNEIVKYYYSKDDGNNYIENTSNSYTFSNLNKNTEYKIKIYGIDINGQKTQEYSEIVKTNDIITLVNYIKNTLYKSDGVNGLYYHDGIGTYTNANQEAGDNSYRYSGANPNNYVCFGSDVATCPNDNLYRIIGLFDDDNDGVYNVKLIKSDYTTSEMLGINGGYDSNESPNNSFNLSFNNYKGSLTYVSVYVWNNNQENNWTESELNKINLNTNYINYLNKISNKWVDMIASSTWYLGGMKDINNTAKAFYNGEKNNNGYGSNPTIYKDEIGLMYPSDYGYASSPENWTTNLYNYNSASNINNNWLYMGLSEWTITPKTGASTTAISVNNAGRISYNSTSAYGMFAIRPVFYLKNNVNIIDGTGTSSNPYRLSS